MQAELRLNPSAPPRYRHPLPYPIKQLKHGQPQRIGNDLNRIQRRIGLPSFYAAQVGLIEAAPFPEFDLAQACLLA